MGLTIVNSDSYIFQKNFKWYIGTKNRKGELDYYDNIKYLKAKKLAAEAESTCTRVIRNQSNKYRS